MQKLFSILWRLSILALPWQTRWIFVDGAIGKFPWEQGTVSFYASWVPLLMTVALAIALHLKKKSSILREEVVSRESRVVSSEADIQTPHLISDSSSDSRLTTHDSRLLRTVDRTTLLLKTALALILIASIFTASLTATLVWWAYVLVIGAFVWALGEMRVLRKAIAAWIVIAVLPHAALGIYQFFTQDVLGSTILGIATHHPWSSGTSVVEHGLYRVLRAYGGLPHPNIFGGWIAVSLALLPALIRETRSKLASYGWLFAGLVLTLALVFTFSRGAWIAAALAFAASAVIAFNATRDPADRQVVIILAVVCALTGVFGIVTQWDHVSTRISATEHLEMWSLLSRTESFVQGWHAFVRRPIAGWGPGAAMLGITEVRKGTMWARVAPEPPHAAPAAFVLETGVLGVLALIALLGALYFEAGSWKLEAGAREKRVQDPTSSASPNTLNTSDGGPASSFQLPASQTVKSPRLHRIAAFLSALDSRLPLVIALTVIAFTDHYLVTLWPGIALLGLTVAVCLATAES